MSIVRGERIASLRNADWRFLLPRPPGDRFDHLLLLGATPGLAQHLVEAGVAARVSEGLLADPADAVIVLSAASGRLGAACSLLKPGGVLYCEIERRSAPRLSVRHVRRMLRAGDISTLAVHWVRPSFSQYQMYLPLDMDPALPWYMNTLYTAAGPAGRLIEPLLRLAATIGAQALAPRFAITAIRGGGTRRPAVLDHPLLPSALKEPSVGTVMLTSGQDERGRVIFLPLDPATGRPKAILKVPRRETFNAYTRREHEALSLVRGLVSPALRDTLPEAIALLPYGSLCVGVEGPVPGRSIASTSGRWLGSRARKVDDLNRATDWLIAFHQQTCVGASALGSVEELLRRYAATFDLTVPERALVERISRLAASSDEAAALPIVWKHHDFGYWNIYRDRDRIHVIDWEGAKHGLPMADLIYFAMHWYFLARNLRRPGQQLRGFRELFLDHPARSRYAAAGRRALSKYRTALHIDESLYTLLLVLTWIDHALDWHERKLSTDEADGGSGSENRYAEYVRLLAGEADSLFQTGGASRP